MKKTENRCEKRFACCISDGAMLGYPELAGERKMIYDPRNFGAVGDGVQNDTAAIQKTLDVCAAGGGGTVRFSKGIFLTGTLKLGGGTTLEVCGDAEIRASTDLRDYADDIVGCIEYPSFDRCLIYAEGKRGLRICGEGCINGRGGPETFPDSLPGGEKALRPMLIRFVDCSNIEFEHILLKDAASWCCNIVNGSDVRMRGVRVDSDRIGNTDGFDFDSCRRVLVESCELKTGDDAICLKSSRPEPCSDFEIRNCTVSSKTAALKLGTASRSGFRNIRLHDCRFHHCEMGAVKLLCVDGGVLEDVEISDVVMERVEGPLFIRLGTRNMDLSKQNCMVYYTVPDQTAGLSSPGGALRRVTIRNIDADCSCAAPDRSGILITGVPGFFIRDVVLENIRVRFPGGGTEADAARVPAEDPARYPEQFFFGVLPAYGLYARHVDGLHLKNVHFELAEPDRRPAVLLTDVAGFEED